MANFARLTMLIGAARVKDLIFMARLVGADEAAAIGLVNEVVPSEEALEPRVMEICSTVSTNAPLTLETAKEALRRIRVQMTPPDGGSDLLTKAYMSEDFREGIEAFFAKRPARWKGRSSLGLPTSKEADLQNRLRSSVEVCTSAPSAADVRPVDRCQRQPALRPARLPLT